ncbi:CLUMA_CG003686, isoform A [Clunio marinus]|uniref:CLUMA_CG003686, isoform A n=1 Tax=Clunio marinus TaxID=568069 RepID=A0A1J1HTZ1_9DIPT|nr:CLUMA_CG003686, isoform A [Clunio marinus]
MHNQDIVGVCLLAFVSCSVASITKAPSTSAATESPSATINPLLRKALLKALSNYDAEDSTEALDEETTTASGEETEESTSDSSSLIKIHTFAIDGDKSEENEVIKTIIISRPRTTLTPPNDPSNDISDRQDRIQINFNKSLDPIGAEGLAESDQNNIQSARSVETQNSLNSEKKEEKPKKKASEKSVTKPITPQTSTTTTTLPPPVTNADGENIEKVAKEDIKISQAPLLAAFTVQQDVNGKPEKVISLFKNPQQSVDNSKRIINMEFKPSQQIPSVPPTVAPATTIQAPLIGSSNQQLLNVFEQKQRQLEEQIRFLQARQREQEEIIRRHHLLQEQQNRQNLIEQQRNRFEEQRLRFLEEQRQRQRFEQEQNFLLRQQQQQAQAQPLQAPQSPNVQFIPSIPLGHTVGISVEQQLPFKGPSEFNPDRPELQKQFSQQQQQQFQLRQFQQQQFQQQQRNAGFNQQQQSNAQPLIQKHEVQQLNDVSRLPTNLELPVRQPQNFAQFTPLPGNLELPQKQFQTFNSAPLSVLPSITDVAPQSPSRTRVFRNDASQTGNFGNFQIQQQQLNPVDSSLDRQLQDFFLQSGINTRSAEDFRIISKVLALNHGVPNNLLFTNTGRFK